MAMTPMGQYPYTGAPMYSAPYQAANRTYPNQYQPQVGYSYVSPQANQAAAQPQQQTFTINGRIVGDISEVAPQEVPMDRSISLFPLADWSKIYAKAWNANGTIDTFVFVPDKGATEQAQQNPYDAIMARLDEIERKIDSRHTGKRPQRQQIQQKEMNENES